MQIKQGDLFWYRNKSDENSIPHPYIVIQDTVINQSIIDTVVICAVTTNRKKASWPGSILLDRHEANLEKPSIIDVSKIRVVKKKDLGEYNEVNYRYGFSSE